MFLHALILAAIVDPCAQSEGATQAAADACWSQQAELADKALNAAYQKVTHAMHASNIDTAPLVRVEQNWITARDKTCEYARSLHAGGTMAPAVFEECVAEVTAARTSRLESLLDSLNAGQRAPSEPVDAAVDAKLNRYYSIVLKHIDSDPQSLLVASEKAWLTYRDAACAVEGGDCLTKLEEQRIELLKSSWYPDCDGELDK
jgi:uncharacterized protein YecT (DUF1311 family)